MCSINQGLQIPIDDNTLHSSVSKSYYLKETMKNINFPERTKFFTIGTFWNNYQNMKEANTIGADKYFHALANCQSAQNGDLIETFLLSLGREITDNLYNNPIRKKLPFNENLKDCINDWNVDMYGLNQGLKYRSVDCKGLVNKYRPNGLNLKY